MKGKGELPRLKKAESPEGMNGRKNERRNQHEQRPAAAVPAVRITSTAQPGIDADGFGDPAESVRGGRTASHRPKIKATGSRSDTNGNNREQWQQDGHERQPGEQLRKIRQEPNATSSGNRSEQHGGAGENHRRTRSEEPKTPKQREKAESRIKHRRPNRRPRTVTAAAMPTATRLFDSF